MKVKWYTKNTFKQKFKHLFGIHFPILWTDGISRCNICSKELGEKEMSRYDGKKLISGHWL